MTWELANEPRCLGSGTYPRSASCTTQTLIAWADEMSTYIKTIDPKHLVSVGDEGFYCLPGATDWTENCGEGVDTVAFAQLENIDVMSFHLYPDSWGKNAAWGTQWIQRHFADARKINKPAMLGEYGWLGKSTRNPVFKQWSEAAFNAGGAGALYWMLSGRMDGGSYYPDYDGFTVYCPSPVCINLSNFAKMMAANKAMLFPPVADHDTATTAFGTPVTLTPADNDVSYGEAVLAAGSIDLDPATSGQQTSLTLSSGTFALQPAGSVLFTPAADFSGDSLASYTIQDTLGQLSNIANLKVTVNPAPQAPLILFSFETSTEGWAGASWEADPGTTTQSSFFHTDGSYGLQVNSNNAWFTVLLYPPLDFTGRTKLKYDLKNIGPATSTSVAIQVGDGWTWCQSVWGSVNAGTETTMEIDLNNLGCTNPDFSKVQAINIWFSTGVYYIDAVRVE
jgi:mannan endo-1,4-beta-mannosidase